MFFCICIIKELGMEKTDFALERRLRYLDKNLHKRFTDTVFALQHILSNYKLIFPDFTDHTELHSLNIIEFCNQLIGDQIDKLNADEIYCILMGCYFHDTGMGVSKEDFVEFSRKIDFGNYFEVTNGGHFTISAHRTSCKPPTVSHNAITPYSARLRAP